MSNADLILELDCGIVNVPKRVQKVSRLRSIDPTDIYKPVEYHQDCHVLNAKDKWCPSHKRKREEELHRGNYYLYEPNGNDCIIVYFYFEDSYLAMSIFYDWIGKSISDQARIDFLLAYWPEDVERRTE